MPSGFSTFAWALRSFTASIIVLLDQATRTPLVCYSTEEEGPGVAGCRARLRQRSGSNNADLDVKG